jgi:3-hydroxyacyl-[acyl-carrier-protein] dehydratase
LVSTHAEFVIPPEHPALPGHFPGRPVVPGVVLLDEVRAAAAAWLGAAPVAAMPQVKFVAPLLPDQRAEIALEFADRSLRFAVSHAGQTLATGIMMLAASGAGEHTGEPTR